MISPPSLLAALILLQPPTPPPDDGADLTRPRMISLDYRDAPMSAVIRDLTAQSGCPVTIYEKMTEWLDTRITLRAPQPLPFWSALDEVCWAGRFGMNVGSGSVPIFRGSHTGPYSDYGPFRVVIEEVHLGARGWQFHLRPEGRPPGGSLRNGDERAGGVVRLHVWAEPRMLIRSAGPTSDLVVLDDGGRSLLPADPAAQETCEFGFTTAAYTLHFVPLGPADQPVRGIKFLRGKAPIVVARLDPRPVAVPLTDAAGKSIRGPSTIVTIRSITRQPIEDEVVVILPGAEQRPETGMVIAATIRRAEPPKPGEAPVLLEFDPGQFECVDAAGKAWTAGSPRLTGEAARPEGAALAFELRFYDKDLQPMPWSGKLDGLTLRYRELTAVPVAVPFEFRDIPLP